MFEHKGKTPFQNQIILSASKSFRGIESFRAPSRNFPAGGNRRNIFSIRFSLYYPLRVRPRHSPASLSVHRVVRGQIPQRQITSAAVFALKPLFGTFAALGFRPPAHGRPCPALRTVCQRLARSGRAMCWLCRRWWCRCRQRSVAASQRFRRFDDPRLSRAATFYLPHKTSSVFSMFRCRKIDLKNGRPGTR